MDHYDVTVHDNNLNPLPLVVSVLLVIFFPIGIIVLIVRTISRIKKNKAERLMTNARTESIKTETSISQSKEIAAYHELYTKGILTQAEFEAKKDSILLKLNNGQQGVKRLKM